MSTTGSMNWNPDTFDYDEYFEDSELGDVKGYEQYKRDMEHVAPWNEGIE